MTDMGASVRTAWDEIRKLTAGFQFVREMDVLVGIPAEKNEDHGSLNNASLLYLHENGSPVNNIPPRPVLKEGINDPEEMPKIQALLQEGIEAALQGNLQGAENAYQRAGMAGAAAVQKKFTDGGLAANAPITITGGWMRNKVSGVPVHVKGKGNKGPLIDTGALRQSITFVVRKKGNK